MATPQKQADDGEGARPNPLSDPNNVKKLEATKEFCQLLVKAIKSIGLYRHATARFGELLEKPFKALDQTTAQLGPISFKVETQAFTLFGQDLLGSETGENLPYKFYRDGIRHLVFRPGFTRDELLKLTLIATSDPRRGDDGVLAQLWAGGFENLEYVVVEGFAVGEMSEDEVQVEVDQVVGYLYNRLRSKSDDYLRFARVSAEDLELKLDDVESVRGAVIASQAASDELKRRIADELREDEALRLFGKLVTALFQTIEGGGLESADELREVFVQVLDSMLLQEDFATIHQILLKLRALERSSTLVELAQALRGFFVAKMAESQRLLRIGELLRSGKPKNAHDIFRYLGALDRDAVVPLLEMLETIDLAENRQMVCEVLVGLGKDTPEPFVHRLTSEKSQTVHDMLYVIDKCDFPDKLKMFGTALKNPNLAVRLEALGVISRSRTEGARKMVIEALGDEAPQIRVGAARAISNYDREKAVIDLLRVIKAPEFEKRDLHERQQIYAALGKTNLAGAFQHFQSVLAQKSTLLKRKKVVEDKLLAVSGLVGAQSLVAFKLLDQICQDESADDEVMAAARKAAFAVKKALFGDPNADPSTATPKES